MAPLPGMSRLNPAASIPLLALAALGLLAFGAIGALVYFALAGEGFSPIAILFGEPIIWRYARFTLWQAFLSTLISVVIAAPVAVILFENKSFSGRGFLLRLFALPLVLPQIVAVLAIVSLYGNQGFVTLGVKNIGIDLPSIYGLNGILIAHVFFNFPLIVRVVLGVLSSMPSEYERLAHQLSLGLFARFRYVYLPYARSAIFNAASLVFMLCVTSFTVVLTLGGGPSATTLEVAIYQALTFDFDVGRAVILTFLQLGLTVIAVIIFARAGGELSSGVTLQSGRAMVERKARFVLAFNYGVIIAAGLFVLAPFVAILVKGLGADLVKLMGQSAVQRAIFTSLVLGFGSGILAIFCALALCEGAVKSSRAGRFRRWLFSNAGSLILVMPPIVLASGWFILLRPFVRVYDAAPYMVVAVNAAMALPFAMPFILPARQVAAQRHDRLCAQLGIYGWQKWRLVLLPVMAKPISIAFAFAFALSLGDLGVIALFGSEQVQTLPYLILQRMGSYRTDDAAGLALILCVITLALIYIADRVDRSNSKGTLND